MGPLTWFEEHHGLHAGEFSGVNRQRLEAAEGLLQCPDVQGGRQQFAGGQFGDSQQRAALQGHGPLDGTEQEQLAPCFFQQDHLGRGGQSPPKPLSPPKPPAPAATTAGWAEEHLLGGRTMTHTDGRPQDPVVNVVGMLNRPHSAGCLHFWGVPVAP